MKRATAIRAAAEFHAGLAVDRVVLDADDRQRRRIVLTGENGTTFLLDLDRPTMLRDGDGLVLDDGSIVVVAGQVEPLIEARAPTAHDFVRLAWHLGNRHTDVQIAGDRIRFRHDHVLEEMVRGLGASATAVDAAFDPEPPAPGGSHGHHHGHDHGS